MEKNTKTLLSRLQKDNYRISKMWNDKDYLVRKHPERSLTRTNTILPKMYGLPKTHKENIPMRPVVSCVNSPTNEVGKALYNILKQHIPLPRS